MRTKLKMFFSTTTVIAALAAGPAIYAHADTPNQGSKGTMQGGQGGMTGQGGMMNMMGQMNQMMTTCNNMMQGMGKHQAPKVPKEGKAPKTEE